MNIHQPVKNFELEEYRNFSFNSINMFIEFVENIDKIQNYVSKNSEDNVSLFSISEVPIKCIFINRIVTN